jgi:hypothetical protein
LQTLFNETWSEEQRENGRIVAKLDDGYKQLSQRACALCEIIHGIFLDHGKIEKDFRSHCLYLAAGLLPETFFEYLEGVDYDFTFDWRSSTPVYLYVDECVEESHGEPPTSQTRVNMTKPSRGPYMYQAELSWEKKDMTLHFLVQNLGSRYGYFVPSSKINFERLKEAIHKCQQTHQCQIGTTHLPQGMCLLDCLEYCVVPSTGKEQYIALSYVWGADVVPQSSTGSAFANTLPRVVRDAIEVTKSLGYRYLWVDKYCIPQLSPDLLKAQIDQMDQIYSLAIATVVAAGGKDASYGLPGLSHRDRLLLKSLIFPAFSIGTAAPEQRWLVKESTWSTRGWTFQEGLLSTRRLVFVDSHVIFECNASHWNELQSIEGEAAATIAAEFSMLRLFEPPGPVESLWKSVRELRNTIEAYYRRQLTMEDDAYNAIKGVINRYKLISQSRILDLWGTPFISSEEAAGECQKPVGNHSFLVHLSWYHPQPDGLARRLMKLPSWSWVGWRGGNMMWFLPTSFDGITALAEIVNIHDGGTLEDSILEIRGIVLRPYKPDHTTETPSDNEVVTQASWLLGDVQIRNSQTWWSGEESPTSDYVTDRIQAGDIELFGLIYDEGSGDIIALMVRRMPSGRYARVGSITINEHWAMKSIELGKLPEKHTYFLE